MTIIQNSLYPVPTQGPGTGVAGTEEWDARDWDAAGRDAEAWDPTAFADDGLGPCTCQRQENAEPAGNVVEFHPRAVKGAKPGRQRLTASEAGMATAEYAIATLAAVGFAGLLVFILRSDEVRGFLLTLIRTALALP